MLTIIDGASLSNAEKIQQLKRPQTKQADRRSQVDEIIGEVRAQGDSALQRLTQRYDGAQLTEFKVSDAELRSAKVAISPSLQQAIQHAIKRISTYQKACLPKTLTVDSQDGIVCQRIPKAIDSVGLYVPGGTAPLVSTLMMLAIPATLAGCRQIVICTPPNADGHIHPALLATAAYCGVETIYKLGGAQAIAAMAYGSERIPKVDKIFGPGNAWVTAAKQAVARDPDGAAIDLPAGPSEVLVIADAHANPEFVAADLLSQAEHGVDSQVILLSTSRTLAEQVVVALDRQLAGLSRKDLIEQALQHARIIVLNDIETAMAWSNHYAPEHLILQLTNAESYVDLVENASAVFVGAWTPETMGDYVNGANHVLPTEGYAKTLSGLSVLDFMKYLSVQTVSEQGLRNSGKAAMELAEVEQLGAHCQAVALRLKQQDSTA